MKQENNKKIVWGVAGIIVLVAVFYGGMTYGGNNVRASMISRGQGLGAGARTRGIGGNAFGAAGGFTAGSIISKDDKSITVSLISGGSKIIFLDTNTKISKSATGSLTDLAVGTQVSVMGAANSDGSINATTVQIRPSMPVVNSTPTQ
jgi:hypothetical protein